MVTLKTPLMLKDKLIRNRIVVPAMASGTANQKGFVTEKTLKHYQRLTNSKAGIIFVEYSFINENGRSEKNQLGINKDSQIKNLGKLSKVIQKSGALSGVQLVHAGSKTTTALTKDQLLAPSKIPLPSKDTSYEVPIRANQKLITLIQNEYVESAKRAIKAGFDIIEIHSAHGYGINQWLSPITNKRKDKYGGSRKNRMRFLSEIITKIKQFDENVLISVRIPAIDFLQSGLTIQDGIYIAKILENLGVDLINVSSGLGGWRRPIHKIGEGYLVEYAKKIQARIKTPVIGVGGIKSKNYINTNLKKRSFSFAAMGRAILENPKVTSNFKL